MPHIGQLLYGMKAKPGMIDHRRTVFMILYTLVLCLSSLSHDHSPSVVVLAMSPRSTSSRPLPPPSWKPSPCNRICRYNANVYDGQVCIGCFRDTFEISQWSRMTPDEKAFALEDAADRVACLAATPMAVPPPDGSVSMDELLQQAEGWRSWSAVGDTDTGDVN